MLLYSNRVGFIDSSQNFHDAIGINLKRCKVPAMEEVLLEMGLVLSGLKFAWMVEQKATTSLSSSFFFSRNDSSLDLINRTHQQRVQVLPKYQARSGEKTESDQQVTWFGTA